MYIEETWLSSIKGKSLYYPAAGNDMQEVISVFNGYVSNFYFCDLSYPRGIEGRLTGCTDFPASLGFRASSLIRRGDIRAVLEYRYDESNRRYRWLEPSSLTCTYSGPGGSQVRITYRRGFGQMGLSELAAPELGVFVHRGDSSGEAGSGVCYLANKEYRFGPISRLFDLIGSKAGDYLMVVSDGSNTDITELCRYHGSALDGSEVYEQIRGTTFERYGYLWRCIGWMQRRYGPTLVWGLTNTRLLMTA